MNVHHLYYVLQGLVTLYFVVVVIPSVGIIVYQTPSAPVPTFFTESQTSTSPDKVTSLGEIDGNHGEEDSYIILPVYIDDDGQDSAISPIPTSETHPPRLIPTPAVHFQHEDSRPHSVLSRQKTPDLLPVYVDNDGQNSAISPIPTPAVHFQYWDSDPPSVLGRQKNLDLLPQQQKPNARGNSFCFLALGVVLGTVGVHRFVGPRHLPRQGDGNVDRANPEWSPNVLPTPTIIDESLHDQELAKPCNSKIHAQDIWTRLRGPEIKPVYPISSRPVPSAAPSGAYGPSIRNNKAVRKVPVGLFKDFNSDIQTTTAPTTVRSAVVPCGRLGSGVPAGVFGRAPGHVWNIRPPLAPKAPPISVFNDAQIGLPTCDRPSTISSLSVIPSREHPAVSSDAGSNLPITAPIKATFYVKPPYINYKKTKTVKPLAVNTLNIFKDRRTSITASSMAHSSDPLNGGQSLPLTIETAPCVTPQTESNTYSPRKYSHFFEAPIDCKQATTLSSIAQPTIGPDNCSNLPITVSTGIAISGSTRSPLDAVDFIATPLTVSILNNLKDEGKSNIAPPRVQSSDDIDGDVETIHYITAQTESSTQNPRMDAYLSEDPIDCGKVTIPSSIIQPTVGIFPVEDSTEYTVSGAAGSTFDAVNFITPNSFNQTDYKHTIASVLAHPTVSVDESKISDLLPDKSIHLKNTSPSVSILGVVPPLSVDACEEIISGRLSTSGPLTNYPIVSSTAALSSAVTVPLGICKTPVRHRQPNNSKPKNIKPASHSTSTRQPAKIFKPEVPRVPEFDDVFYIKPSDPRPEVHTQSDIPPVNPNMIDLFKEDMAELPEVSDHETSNHDMIIDTTLEISPIRTVEPSSYPALFGPNAVRFPSAALDLATLVANPPVFAPWKFEELMTAADAPQTEHIGSMDQSSHDMDVDMDYEPYKPRKTIDWSEYDKAFAKQELHWRTIIQSHPPRNNFWSQYPRAPSHRAW